jgi:NADH:ubiquinone oxidoreductase subunit 2 (subunit N)
VRFIRAMYIGDREADPRPLSLSAPLQTALVVCAVFVIIIGVYPQPFIKAAESVVAAVLPAAVPVAQR